jgi:hypothetical protein
VDGRIVAPAGRGGRGGGGGGGGGGGRGGRGGDARGNVLNAEPGDAYRFNWNTPFILSPHNPGIVWLGGNRVFKSLNRGETWVASGDLTKQVDRCAIAMMGVAGTQPQISKNDGVTSFSTIVSISESPVIPGVVWAGTDDGNLQVSRDGGVTFTEVGKNISGLPAGALTGPNPYWISRVDASHFDAGTAYVSVDGHRSDDLHPYVFVTRDYGRTFTNITNNLPAFGNVQVIREDPKNKDLLYAGTEVGLQVSLDGGKTWEKFENNLPTVRVDEVLVHPRDGDLIVATHGRSIWIAEDVTPLQQLTPAVAAEDAHLFTVRPAIAYLSDTRAVAYTGGHRRFMGENPPRGTAISYYLKSPASGEVKVSVMDAEGRTLCVSDGAKAAGINRVQWALVAPMLGGDGGGRGGPANTSCSGGGGGRGGGGGGGRGGAAGGVTPGTYTVRLTVGGRELTTTVEVLEDKWMGERR